MHPFVCRLFLRALQRCTKMNVQRSTVLGVAFYFQRCQHHVHRLASFHGGHGCQNCEANTYRAPGFINGYQGTMNVHLFVMVTVHRFFCSLYCCLETKRILVPSHENKAKGIHQIEEKQENNLQKSVYIKEIMLTSCKGIFFKSLLWCWYFLLLCWFWVSKLRGMPLTFIA